MFEDIEMNAIRIQSWVLFSLFEWIKVLESFSVLFLKNFLISYYLVQRLKGM